MKLSQLTKADSQYADIETFDWAEGNRAIEYHYDGYRENTCFSKEAAIFLAKISRLHIV
ncbi:hypothetical protein ACFL1G_04530 [Planctomycetota bacterium]